MALESFWFELAGIGHQSVKVTAAGGSVLRPQWFAPFLADRATRKPSPHTMKAYRQDFDAMAARIVGSKGDLAAMSLGDITTKAMRGAFAQDAETHKAASIQRCWSTWNVLCAFLYTSDLIPANPMPLVGRLKIAKTLPKGLPPTSVQALLAAVDSESERRASDWMERDRALILTSLLAGLRADELLRANVGDVRRREDGAIIQVSGRGDKDRSIPVELALVEVLVEYLDSRAVRFPATARGRPSTASGLAAWPPTAPLFVGSDGDRITRGTLQYRVLRAFRRAGIDEDRARGALVHVLRHTFATELASAGVSVYALMRLLGHESMVTSQRYVTAAASETRAAAAQNRLYGLLKKPGVAARAEACERVTDRFDCRKFNSCQVVIARRSSPGSPVRNLKTSRSAVGPGNGGILHA